MLSRVLKVPQLTKFARKGALPLPYAFTLSFLFILFLALLTSDVNRSNPRFFGPFARFLRRFMNGWRQIVYSEQLSSWWGIKRKLS